MDLRYPIGKFEYPEAVAPAQLAQAIEEIAALPGQMRAAVAGWSDAQLDTPYRPEGWTVRQVVHHTADSHMNSYVRFRLALTEDEPTIKPYKEALWAELTDGRSAPVEVSLALLDALHERWVMLLGGMSDRDFARAFRHPDRGLVRLDVTALLYAWHGRHHLAHITGVQAT
ncbi:MAG: putative metal-dependent hydrolase [Bryobacteraceae bacterium]|nr:putative metal-dependent hydrolase [Bryobacteraceae bacterium]